MNKKISILTTDLEFQENKNAEYNKIIGENKKLENKNNTMSINEISTQDKEISKLKNENENLINLNNIIADENKLLNTKLEEFYMEINKYENIMKTFEELRKSNESL